MGILEVKNVNKRFGGLQALGDVNLSVAENSVHAIIGPNGAGKSTLLNCLVGKLMPDTGSVLFDGHSVLGRTPHEINQMGILDMTNDGPNQNHNHIEGSGSPTEATENHSKEPFKLERSSTNPCFGESSAQNGMTI